MSSNIIVINNLILWIYVVSFGQKNFTWPVSDLTKNRWRPIFVTQDLKQPQNATRSAWTHPSTLRISWYDPTEAFMIENMHSPWERHSTEKPHVYHSELSYFVTFYNLDVIEKRYISFDAFNIFSFSCSYTWWRHETTCFNWKATESQQRGYGRQLTEENEHNAFGNYWNKLVLKTL